jgi:rhodanese-related sulfurtransferase
MSLDRIELSESCWPVACGARRLTFLGALLLAALLPAMTAEAQSSPDIFEATLAQPDQKTAEVSTEELRGILAEGSATVFDARPFMEYAVGHIPGALNVAAKPDVPMSVYVSDVHEIERVLDGKKDAPIVLYCNGPFCGKSKRLSEELLVAGFTDIRRYQLGAPVWRALGGVMQIEPATIPRSSSTPGAPRSSRRVPSRARGTCPRRR